MIFQDPYQTLNPRQRVRTIVAEPLRVQGVAKGEHDERVRRALEDVGLDPERFGERYPHQLSGGQRQRVAIAAALVLEPDGLICDEPVSMLDVSVQAQILAVLLELQRRRELALLFITHDLSLAWTLCDRIAVMYLGRVVEQGTAVDVIERPQHPYTQALVSAIPVPTPGGGGERELLSGELPDATEVPPGCRFHPRCPRRFEPCDRVDPPLIDAGPRDSSPPACSTTRRWRASGEAGGPDGAERWREIAGPGRPARARAQRNAITDVPGVRVGHAQAASGERHRGHRGRPAVAAGARRDRELSTAWASSPASSRSTSAGAIETPVYLCGTHALGTVYQAAVLASGRGPEEVVIPVVGECDDGDMADSRTVTAADVERALEALGPEVAEGTVGAGTGMICFGFPGGIGTASREVGGHFRRRAAALQLRRPRVPRPARADRVEARRRRARHGSCIAVCATDAPLWPHQLRRLALRPLLGLARTGSYASEGSGEIGLAFSTSVAPGLTNEELDPYFAAAYEAAQEAVYNCLVAARPGRAPRRHHAGGVPDRGGARVAMSASPLRDEVVDLARALIRIDTSNPPGNETPAAELVAEHLGAAGVECELVGPDPERLNLVARLAGSGRGPSLMLLGHTDVVPAPPEGWTVPPFEAAVRDGRLIGRGASDMKNELAARAVALAALARSGVRPAGDVVLVAEADEERNISDVGMSWLVRERPDLRCDFAVNEGGGTLLELADGRRMVTVSVGEKRVASLRLRVFGTAGHASVPQRADNAVLHAATAVERLLAYEAPMRLVPVVAAALDALGAPADDPEGSLAWAAAQHPVLVDLLPAVARMTVTPTGLRTYEPSNVVPPFADVICDCRALPDEDADDVAEHVERALGNGFRYELELLEPLAGGTESPTDTSLFAALREYVAERVPGAELLPLLSPGFTDSHCPARGLGHRRLRLRPGDLRRPRRLPERRPRADEAVEIDDLVEMAHFHLQLLMPREAAAKE